MALGLGVRVLDVDADGAGLDGQPHRLGDGLGAVAIARLHVGGHRHVDRLGDAADGIQHLGAGDDLAVGISEHPRDARAR